MPKIFRYQKNWRKNKKKIVDEILHIRHYQKTPVDTIYPTGITKCPDFKIQF